jgi:hypothetical protein
MHVIDIQNDEWCTDHKAEGIKEAYLRNFCISRVQDG